MNTLNTTEEEKSIVTENYQDCGIDVARIIKRILTHAPSECIQGLKEIRLLDKDPVDKGFARYFRTEGRIELYVADIVGWQPWILKKSYVFPYLTIGIALGHEIDHHVHRKNNTINKEDFAERNAFKYIYPSLGVFKPVVKVLNLFTKIWGSEREKGR